MFESIVEQDYLKEREIELDIPRWEGDIKLPKKYAQIILPSTATIAKAQENYGLRLQKTFQIKR